jgi:hypothetical protein
MAPVAVGFGEERMVSATRMNCAVHTAGADVREAALEQRRVREKSFAAPDLSFISGKSPKGAREGERSSKT